MIPTTVRRQTGSVTLVFLFSTVAVTLSLLAAIDIMRYNLVQSRLQSALDAEQVGLKPVKNYAAAFRTPAVILLALQFFCWSIGVYGFVLWLPSILKAGAQMDMIEAGWLSALPYLAAVIGMLLVSWGSDKLQKRKRFVWPPLLIASVAFYGSYALGAEHFWLSYTLLVIAGAWVLTGLIVTAIAWVSVPPAPSLACTVTS